MGAGDHSRHSGRSAEETECKRNWSETKRPQIPKRRSFNKVHAKFQSVGNSSVQCIIKVIGFKPAEVTLDGGLTNSDSSFSCNYSISSKLNEMCLYLGESWWQCISYRKIWGKFFYYCESPNRKQSIESFEVKRKKRMLKLSWKNFERSSAAEMKPKNKHL